MTQMSIDDGAGANAQDGRLYSGLEAASFDFDATSH